MRASATFVASPLSPLRYAERGTRVRADGFTIGGSPLSPLRYGASPLAPLRDGASPLAPLRYAERGNRGTRPGARGFTLLELLVALTLAALVLALAHRVFSELLDGAARAEAARAALDREANARRLLTTVIGSLDVSERDAGFRGEPHRVAFTAWFRDARGRHARGAVTLALAESALVVTGLRPEPWPLLHGVTGLDLDYLLDYGAQERWVREWISPASAPTAIRLRVAREGAVDTLLLIVGSRG